MKRQLFTLFFLAAFSQMLMAQAEVAPQVLNLDDIVEKIGYPMEAKSAGASGKVVAKVKVSPKGKVSEHEIAESPSVLLSDAVSKYIPDLKFKPAEKEGAPVEAWVMLPFNFEIPETKTFTDLNEALASMGDVESLDLSNKQLKAVDSRMPQLKNLRFLNLSNNMIREIPVSLTKLKRLEELNMSGNGITVFPKHIKKFKNLQKLIIAGHKLNPYELAKIRTMLRNVEIITD